MALRRLFIDMNAYFASVEQQDDPALRGKPVAVVPVIANTTCVIAASYECKAKGIKTGTPVWEAMARCPGLILKTGRHERYVEVHKGVVRAVERHLPVADIMSIDEMNCQLMGEERTPDNAAALARAIKREIMNEVGECMRSSVGIGPNVLLAKVAADMQKPDGLTIVDSTELPHRLYGLKLDDFPGIGPRMKQRLHRYGILNVERLLALTQRELSTIWGSRVLGERWFYLFRGEEIVLPPTHRRSVSQSHILPPELRHDAGTHGVLVRLIHKAAARLRGIGYWTGFLAVSVKYRDGHRWEAERKLTHCQDTLALMKVFGRMWRERPIDHPEPFKASMVLGDLKPKAAVTPSLFEGDRRDAELGEVMDRVNRAFGKHSIRFGAALGHEDQAPVRIAFDKIPKFDPAYL